jgi:cysteine desulfurase
MKQRIYLDYAATTPVDPAVLRAMEPYFSKKFGNPGSLHASGQEAIAAIDQSREKIAHAIGAEFREVIFTASATEANNLALRGVVERWRAVHKMSAVKNPRIIVSAIEHESVLETARELERDGVDVTYLPVDRHGIVDLKKLREALDGQIALVSVMYGNNEIGTIQPIAEIASIVRAAAPRALIHTDAAQAFQFLDCDVRELDIDLMTLSSHKLYGPKGAAVLYVRGANGVGKKNISKHNLLEPILFGGGQEFGLRSGTENVPTIVGFAKAVELAAAARAKESKRIAALRDRLWRGIKKIYPKAEVNGIEVSEGTKTLPHILNVYFPDHEAQDLLTRFDLAGLAASSGSACRSRAFEPSYVIEALGYSKEHGKQSIRFSLGKPTVIQYIDKSIKIIYDCLGGQK